MPKGLVQEQLPVPGGKRLWVRDLLSGFQGDSERQRAGGRKGPPGKVLELLQKVV